MGCGEGVKIAPPAATSALFFMSHAVDSLKNEYEMIHFGFRIWKTKKEGLVGAKRLAKEDLCTWQWSQQSFVIEKSRPTLGV